ncbi:MAG: hypothetical protein ACOC5K_03380 [Chloroflexota bacterium]
MEKLKKWNMITVAGLVLVVGGLVGIVLGGYLYSKAQGGLDALQAVYEAQGRTMSYDSDGNFIDRGSKEGGDAVLSLLEDEWQYPLDRSNLDPDDPLVNTPDELMVQYAIINYHTLHGTQTVVLEEDVEYQGEVYEAGTYDVPVDGRYFSDLDRNHPLEGPVRDQAWSPLAFGLLSQLIGGVNSDMQAGMAHFMSWSIFVGLGFMFTVAGVFVTIGGVQLSRRQQAEEAAAQAEAYRTAGSPGQSPAYDRA